MLTSFGGLRIDVPDSWRSQGMVTFELPSPDSKVRPNLIVTVERIAPGTQLQAYFERILETFGRRGIKSLEVIDLKDIIVDTYTAKMFLCRWDIDEFRRSVIGRAVELPALEGSQRVDHNVFQAQVTIVRETTAVNITGSFPDSAAAEYLVEFEGFLRRIRMD